MILRVCLVNSFFPPWRGGAETYTYNLARQLVLRGHNVEVFCASNPRKPGNYDVEGVKLTCLPVTSWLYGTPIMARLPERLLKAESDVVHSGFPSPFNAFSSALASKINGVPSVLTWHNDLPPVTTTAKALVSTHDRIVLPVYIRVYRRIISTSNRYAESSPILKKHVDKLTIIPNGVDCRRFHPNIDSSLTRQKLKLHGESVILFVGALSKWHSYKGLDTLINAIASMKKTQRDIVLVVVGDGALRPAYEELTRKLNITDRVIFAGDVPDDELPSFYAASDMLILPSKDRSEGFGLTILEANACGKPAIGSNVGGIPDVIRNEFNGLLVPPNDPQALFSAIALLIENESLLDEMGKNSRTHAEQHDWSRVAEATEQVYREILDQDQG